MTKKRRVFRFAAVMVFACTTARCRPSGPFHWPEVARCLPDVSDLVGTVTQILLRDARSSSASGETKRLLEQLAREHGADTVLCLVDRLMRDWTSPNASSSPERVAAAGRAEAWLAEVGTQIHWN